MNRTHRFTLISARLLIAGLTALFARPQVLTAAPRKINVQIPASSDPEQERASFQVAEGFEVNLFASDPQVSKPIGMNFDADGRLWVVSSSIYPQIKPGQEANDKVIVLEDTKGAGRADKSTVFADGLFIPTGIAPGDGGCYVANSTEILHLKETANSGKADERRVVLSGFGTEDTHHIIHAFRWGPDGRLYFNQSIYIHSHVETPWGTVSLLGSGTWRFRPETMRLEPYCYGQVNPWGIVWNKWGETFETDGAGGEGIAFAFPGSAFQSAVGYDKVLPGLNHGSPKYAGLEVIDGSAMPADYQGVYLTNDFRAHRICAFRLTESGSGYVSRQLPDFIKSSDAAFRPIDIKMGPDGAIYIADWYNPIINHGEVDFRDPRRDHTHGRIWRVTAKGIATLSPLKIAKAPIGQLLDQLRSPEQYARMKAKGVLRERGAEAVAPALAAWVKAIRARSATADLDRLEALWTYESIDVVEPNLLTALLHAKDAHARAAAVRVLSHWAPQIPDAMQWLGEAVRDEHPQVRLEAIRALAAIGSQQSIVIAEQVLDKPMDGNLEWALTQTARDLEPVWMPAFKSGKLTRWAKPAHLARALEDVKSPAAVGVLVEQLKSHSLSPADSQVVIDLLAVIDPAKSPETLFDLATGHDIPDAATRAHVLVALARTAPVAPLPAAQATARLKPLIPAPGTKMNDAELQLADAALRLAGTWHLGELFDTIQSFAWSGDAQPELRNSGIAAMAAFGDARCIDQLKKMTASGGPGAADQAIMGLASIDASVAAPYAADLIANAQGEQHVDLLGAFVKRAGGGAALASALSGKAIKPDTARLALRWLQSQGAQETPLNDLFRKAAGLTTGPTKLSPPQMKTVVAEVMEKGNAANGERIFRSQQTSCFQCHGIGGAGGQLAPDLRAVGASSPIDYLVDSVLDPNKAIKDGYQGYTIATRDGEVYSGIKVRQDDREIVLRDATHDVTIPVSSIKSQKDVGSLMPTGLADTLTHQEFLDLIRFLAELGKPGPYSVDAAPLVRRWRILQTAPDIEPASELPAAVASDGPDWAPAYAMVSGEVPISTFDRQRGATVSWARADLDVSAAGPARLLLNDAKGLTLWVDGKRVDAKPDMTVDLSAGIASLVFRIDVAQRGSTGLRVEIGDIAGSRGHAQPVTGR